MNRLPVLLSVAAGLAVSTSAAGAQGLWTPPACKLNTKHFLVNSAQLYLKNATQAKTADQHQTNLMDAERVLRQAVTEGQADNPAVWYMYGRYYLLTDDMAGADSAFAKALAGQADCADDISLYRRNAWVPHVQTAADAMNNGDFETAKASFRLANHIYQEDPLGFYYLANVFVNEGELDSAVAYFRKTVERVDRADTSHAEYYETSVYNVASIFRQGAPRVLDDAKSAADTAAAVAAYDSAAAWFDRYNTEMAGDPQALFGLVDVNSTLSQIVPADSARRQYLRRMDAALTELLSNPAASAQVLFGTGIALFGEGYLQRAARGFEAARIKNPYFRDNLYNLASTYLSLGSSRDSSETPEQRAARERDIGQKMLPVGRQLVMLDPYNRNSLRMLALAFQYLGEQDSVLLMLETAEDLPFEVSITRFQEGPNGHALEGRVSALGGQALTMWQDSVRADSVRLENIRKSVQTGRDPNTNRAISAAIKEALAKQQPVIEQRLTEVRTHRDKARQVTVPAFTFEFLDASGQVQTTQTVAAQTLPADGSAPFSLTTAAEGIAGWRYRVGG